MFFRGDSKIHAKLFILIREILTLSLEKLVVRKAPVGGIVIILPFSAGDTAVDLGEWWGWFPPRLPVAGFLTASSARAAAQTSSSSLEQRSSGPSTLMQCPAHSGRPGKYLLN